MNYQACMNDFDIQKLIMPDRIVGKGTSRTVYAVKDDQSVIVKEINVCFIGANALEWFIWNAVRATRWGSVFGACLAISESARYLLMERLDNINPADYPNTPCVPVWVQDVKPSAFGKSTADQIKLRDYAMVNLADTLGSAIGHRSAWQR